MDRSPVKNKPISPLFEPLTSVPNLSIYSWYSSHGGQNSHHKMAIPAWKLQLQQNIAKKKVEKIRQEEQRRIQLLPPWKRAAIEQQTQSKNVIIISNNSASTNKSTTTITSSVSSNNNTSPTRTVVVTSPGTATTNNSINSVNNNGTKPGINRTVNIVPANQKSPTRHSVHGGSGGVGDSPTRGRVTLKSTGKSQSVDSDGSSPSPSKTFDRFFDKAVSDEHCVSVHNNPFLRQEKKKVLSKTLSSPSMVVGNRQKVQDSSTSPSAGISPTPRVAWNSNKSPLSNGVTLEHNGGTTSPLASPGVTSPSGSIISSTVASPKSSVPRNSIIIEKQTPPLIKEPQTKATTLLANKTEVASKSPSEPANNTETRSSSVQSARSSRDRERKLSVSVSEMLSRFGRAASHDEKERVRRMSNSSDNDPDSPRSKSSNRSDYSQRRRERSPSPVRNRYRVSNNAKPRPKSTPVEIRTSLSSGRRSPSPKPLRKPFIDNQASKAQAPKLPANQSTSNKVVINNAASSKKAPAPTISISDSSSRKSAPSVVVNSNTSATTGTASIVIKRNESQDIGRKTPPARRKQTVNLPASAIIDLSTAGPIQEASGKPPADPEQIAKEKASSSAASTTAPQQSNNSPKAYVRNGVGIQADKPKPNTVSSLLGSYGGKKYRAPAPLVKDAISTEAIPYPKDFRRPKSWHETQNDNDKIESIPSKTLDNTKSEPAETNQTDSSSSSSTSSRLDNDKPKTDSISPIPRSGGSSSISPIPSSSSTISPIPKSSSTISPIPKSSSSISPIPKSTTTVSPIPKTDDETPSSSPHHQHQATIITQNGDASAEEKKTETTTSSTHKPGIGGASQDAMEKARALKKKNVKKKVNYEVVGGDAPTGKPSMLPSKSGRNRSKLQVSF